MGNRLPLARNTASCFIRGTASVYWWWYWLDCLALAPTSWLSNLTKIWVILWSLEVTTWTTSPPAPSVYGSAPGRSIFQMTFFWNNNNWRCDRCGEESWFFVSGIYQKPLLASSLLNTWLQWAGLASHLPWGSGWTSRRTYSFKGIRCTQMHIAPSFFGTITMPAHQGVGLSTLEMTKCFHSIVHFES